MLLVKKVCQELKKPVFEVMSYPARELEYWACFFSIDANKDKPIVETVVMDQESQAKALSKIFR